MPDHDTASEGQFRMDPTAAIDPVGFGVDLGDQIGQHGVPDRAFGWRALALLVEPGFRDAEDSAGDLDGELVRGDQLERRVSPFGLVSSLRTSTARRVTSSSVSSSAMRFMAAANSALSAVVGPA